MQPKGVGNWETTLPSIVDATTVGNFLRRKEASSPRHDK